MKKRFLLLASIIITGTFANAEINMPSAPVYDTPSHSYSSSGYYSPSSAYKKTNTNFSYTEKDKKEFYDAFEPEFFKEMSNELISEGFSKNSVSALMAQLKPRFNRQELENSTWSCVTRHPVEELKDKKNSEKIIHACFSGWISKYIEENAVLAQEYLRK